jgi:hypothetical protein
MARTDPAGTPAAAEPESRALAALLVLEDGKRHRAYVEHISKSIAFVNCLQAPASVPCPGQLEFSSAVMGFQMPFEVTGTIRAVSREKLAGGMVRLELQIAEIKADRPGAVDALLQDFSGRPVPPTIEDAASAAAASEAKEAAAEVRKQRLASRRGVEKHAGAAAAILKVLAVLAVAAAVYVWLVPVLQGSRQRDRMTELARDLQMRAWRLEDEAQSGWPSFSAQQRYREAAETYGKAAELYGLVLSTYADSELASSLDPYLRQAESGQRRTRQMMDRPLPGTTLPADEDVELLPDEPLQPLPQDEPPR